MRDTKEQILRTALRLFAKDGYEAVSVNAIASELNITKAALYKHYKNKRNIFDHIVARMEQRDAEQARTHNVPAEAPAESEESRRTVSPEAIISFSKAMFRYWTEDEFASSFRKMLTLEQFRDPEMNKLYQQYLCSGPLSYIRDLFTALHLPRPQEKAVAFYAPMFLFYSLYDGTENKTAVLSELDEYLENALRP